MNEWLAAIPLWWAKIVTVILFAGITLWTWLRPREYVMAGAPTKKAWRDLRIWATILMLMQTVLYLLF